MSEDAVYTPHLETRKALERKDGLMLAAFGAGMALMGRVAGVTVTLTGLAGYAGWVWARTR